MCPARAHGLPLSHAAPSLSVLPFKQVVILKAFARNRKSTFESCVTSLHPKP